MRRLLLLRHAKSSWADDTLADHERPLNRRGQRDAPRIANWLVQQNIPIDVCWTSNAERATQTADRLLEQGQFSLPRVQVPELYHASPDQIVMVARQLPETAQSALLVGHNPGLEELVAHWSGLSRHFPTAAIIGLEFAEANWDEISLASSPTELFFQTPKQLPDMTTAD